MQDLLPKQKHHSAFTIVELLIVIVVIAILSTISIVTYSGIQNRAYEAAVKSDLSNAAKRLAIIRSDLGRYPQVTTEFPAGFKFTKRAYRTSTNNAMYCLNNTTDEFVLMVFSKSGVRYLLTNSGIEEEAGAAYVDPCTFVGTTWSSPPVPRTAIHGYRPGGLPPGYTEEGWSAGWRWTNDT